MRERINRLAKGIIDTEVPLLVLQPSQINEKIEVGQMIKKEFYVTSENALHIKGLVYSTNPRVHVLNSAFGGTRSYINFELDSRYLDDTDIIEGSFYLVTNAGEKEIPYSFKVEAGNSGKILGNLKTPKDFANLASKDFDTALRLFEYQDFTEVPFMQDMYVRTIYDGLKGHGNRTTAMEEFLVALNAKKPIRISVSTKLRRYDNIENMVQDEIIIEKDGWGDHPITVKADGDFIQISQRKITGQDFQDDICRLIYQIAPARLHGGKNYGSISLRTMAETFTIPVQVSTPQLKEQRGQEGESVRYGRYLTLRLEYETDKSASLLNQLLEEVDQLNMVGKKDETLSLITAEIYVLAGKKEQAKDILESCRQQITDKRQEHMELYCLMQYIALQVEPNDNQKASLIRLLRKYVDEGNVKQLMFFLLIKLDDSLWDNPQELLTMMQELYQNGCHSPFLYLQATKLMNEKPELLSYMGKFEIQVLYFAGKRALIEQDLATKVARLASNAKYYNRLYCNLLTILYEAYPEKEMLEAICGLLIKGERRGEEDFVWYERALKERLSLTRLYEYYLYSLPKNYSQLIPKEVLLYFSYDHDLDRHSKAVLYANILTYMKREIPLYQEYEKAIHKFATEQIFESRINNQLAVIYEQMIYSDMIDVPMAKVLPGILKSYCISCNSKDMKYAVVCYEEIVEEGIYPLRDGVTYAPLFSEHSVIMFEDAYGNRYKNIGYRKTPVMEKSELEQRCFEVYPDHPMLLLKACRESACKEKLDDHDVLLLEKGLTELNLHPLYKKVLISKVIEYYQYLVGDDVDEARAASIYLLSIDKKSLNKEQRNSICEFLINQNYVKEAFEMIREYGSEGVSSKGLLKLCTKMILEKLFDQDELLLKLAYQVFEGGKCDSIILDYLCEYFNGTSSQMYQVLRKGISEHVETYDLEERLLAQMLFSDQTKKIDKVFSLYAGKKKTSENIVKAYFTMKSTEYFLHDIPADNQVFSYLEGMINGTIEKDKLSTIYLLSLTKYYATLPELEDDQKQMCQTIVAILLNEGIIFPYFKELAHHIAMPEDILDKAIIQYIGQKDSKIDLQVRILPDEERYHSDEMKRMYQGVFVKQKVLFEGEILEYQIYEQKGQERILMSEGSVTCELPSSQTGGESRFSCLNQMSLCLSMNEEEVLKKTMKDYLTKTATVEELFELM